jgi:predicted transcriptional regulator
MTAKEKAKNRAALLKRLRAEHEESVARTKALLKEQKALRKQICQAMRTEPQIVPQLAETTGIPSEQVLWHVTAMKKYGLVVENGMCGEYYLYQMAEDK